MSLLSLSKAGFKPLEKMVLAEDGPHKNLYPTRILHDEMALFDADSDLWRRAYTAYATSQYIMSW